MWNFAFSATLKVSVSPSGDTSQVWARPGRRSGILNGCNWALPSNSSSRSIAAPSTPMVPPLLALVGSFAPIGFGKVMRMTPPGLGVRFGSGAT